jgi:hypothetical protein
MVAISYFTGSETSDMSVFCISGQSAYSLLPFFFDKQGIAITMDNVTRQFRMLSGVNSDLMG